MGTIAILQHTNNIEVFDCSLDAAGIVSLMFRCALLVEGERGCRVS